MELLIKENLFDDVLEVSQRNAVAEESTAVEEEMVDEVEKLLAEELDEEEAIGEPKDTDDDDECNMDPLTKSFQSIGLGTERDETVKTFKSLDETFKSAKALDETLKSNNIVSRPVAPVRGIETQDSTQKLQSADNSRAEQRRAQRRKKRRRRRSLKESITSLFTSSSHGDGDNDDNSCVSKSRNSKRTPSPRDPQRTKRTERSQVFSFRSQFLKRRSGKNRRKHGQRRFSALSLEFDLFHSSDKMTRRRSLDRRSMPLRQSSSTAFTSAALEVSQVFDRDQLEADRELDHEETEDEVSLPFGRQIVY